VLEEGAFRAARFGVRARLPDAAGRLRPIADLLDDALELAREHAGELDCEDALGRLPAMLASGGGAERQRAAHGIAGMDGLLRELTSSTSRRGAQSALHM
jgi:carboxylate-amine ligase